MDMPPVQQQPQPQQPQPPVSPIIPKQPRTSASRSKKKTKSDAAPSTAKRTRTSVATHVLKANSDVPTNADEPVNSEAHLNSEAKANSEIPVNTEAASPPKQKRRRLVAAYEYDDLEPTPATTSEPVQTSPQQKPARFKRRAQKPARAKVPITEITYFTVEEGQTPSTPVAEHSQALMVLPIQAVPLTSPTASSTSSEVDEEIVCKEHTTAEAETAVSDPKTPISDHGTPTPIPQSPMKIPEDAIVHDTAPENYRSDTVVEESDKVVMEALQSLAMTGAESIKPNSVAPITESDKAKSVLDPVQDAEKSTQADTEDDDSSDDDNDDEAPLSHQQQKWESTSQWSQNRSG
ncbi:uncharacterized protein LOC135150789 [Daucus carota subsp. sativus]|uniref:uncharacterized protein LOC135150789 n=1 Tax=Daucus carota subsp. sativus TaxID=79200 RepID=UPI0030828892